jgi:hypothetical protein
MKKPILKLFTVVISGLSIISGIHAQTGNEKLEQASIGQYAESRDILSVLIDDYAEAKAPRLSSNLDVEIKASRIHVDLNSEQQVEFSARTSWATDFVWKFGDGSTLSGFQNVKHQFSKPGTYRVTLLASNEAEVAKKEIEIQVVDNAAPLELEEMQHYIVFPHDNKLEADIQLNLPRKEKKLVFQILDVAGNPVNNYEIGRVKKRELIHVDLKNLENGKYYAVIKGKRYSLVSKLTVTR